MKKSKRKPESESPSTDPPVECVPQILVGVPSIAQPISATGSTLKVSVIAGPATEQAVETRSAGLAGFATFAAAWAGVEVEIERARQAYRRVKQAAMDQAGEAADGPVVEKKQPKGFEGLSRKKLDMASYLDKAGLTQRQYDCASLKLEYGLSEPEIADRLGISRQAVGKHLAAACAKINKIK